MKKITLFLLSIVAVIALTTSCNDQKTDQERLKEENKAIERFISKNGLIILNEYPASGVFKEKEYFKHPSTGVYIHVIDSGNGTRARSLKDEIQVRFEDQLYFKSDTVKYDSDWLNGQNPYSFIYGNSLSYGSSQYDLGCDGWAIPLDYVGEESVVSLIIPSSSGSYTDNRLFRPVYYEKLKYTRFY